MKIVLCVTKLFYFIRSYSFYQKKSVTAWKYAKMSFCPNDHTVPVFGILDNVHF